MKKNAVLYILLIFLVIVNGFFLYNHFGKSQDKIPKGNKGPKGSPVEFIVKELGFNDDLMAQYQELEDTFHQNARTSQNEARQLKDTLFSHISNDTINKSEIDSITNLIGEIEKNKEVLIFEHLRNIYDLCNDDQKEKFSKIVEDAMRKGGSRPQGPPGRESASGREGPPPPRH